MMMMVMVVVVMAAVVEVAVDALPLYNVTYPIVYCHARLLERHYFCWHRHADECRQCIGFGFHILINSRCHNRVGNWCLQDFSALETATLRATMLCWT